jgi:hypothetical protein
MVLLLNEVLFHRGPGGWEAVPIKPPPSLMPVPVRREQADHALLAGGALYLGYDRGEWGGALLALDVLTGRCARMKLRAGWGLPIRDLRSGPGTALWVVEGLAHLSGREGRLSRSEGKGWRTLCSSSREGRVAWDLSPACLDAVDFDGKGRLVLLSGDLGLVRLDGNRWTRLTPDWPRFAFVSCLHVTPAGVAVVGLYDAGVLLIDLKSRLARRVALEGPGEGQALSRGASP